MDLLKQLDFFLKSVNFQYFDFNKLEYIENYGAAAAIAIASAKDLAANPQVQINSYNYICTILFLPESNSEVCG